MVVCYIAQSLDGYIATPDGGLDWLPQPDSEGEDFGYAAFYRSIDGILMGRKTFDVVTGFGLWPYPDKPSWVFTHKVSTSVNKTPNSVNMITQSPKTLVSSLENQGFKRLWLVGGSELISAFRQERLIDEYIITTIPTILGHGIPLFIESDYREYLCCTDSRRFENGISQATFIRI